MLSTGAALLACLSLVASACHGKSIAGEEPPDATGDGALDASDDNRGDAGSEGDGEPGERADASIDADATARDGALDASDVNPADTGSEGSIDAGATIEAGTVVDDCAEAGQMSMSADLTFPIFLGSSMQEAPQVGFDGQSFLLSWNEVASNGSGPSYASRITPEGVVLDNPPIQLVTGGVTSLAFNGNNYLLVWESDAILQDGGWSVLASRITPQGTNLDPAGIVVSSSSSATSNRGMVACEGRTCLLVWADISKNQVKGVRIDATAGTVLDASPILLATGRETFIAPIGVDFDGSDYFVVLDESGNGQGDNPWVKVTPDGAVASRGTLALPQGAYGSGTYSSMASGGSGHLFMWGTLMSFQLWHDYASRVNLDGGVLDPAGIPLTTQGATQATAMGVGFDGRRYLALWTAPASPIDGGITGVVAGTVIEGIRISPDGCIDPSPSLRVLGANPGSIASLQLASSGRGQSLLAFSQCDSQLANCLLHARVVTSE